MRKTMPFLLLLFCLPFLAFAPERSGERAPIIRPGKDYALFFAVHQYEDSQLTDLPNTVKNTREIEKVLKDKYAFETEFIENPKLDDIEQKLEEYRWKFASGAFPKDGQLLVFFSGHGVQEYNNGYFLPADADPDRILLQVEDIGRHNCLDKLCGAALQGGISTHGRIILSSGRISSEMLNKARRLEVPLLCSRTSPTSLSVALAASWNITIVAYLRQDRMRIYTHPQRVVDSALGPVASYQTGGQGQS